MSSTLQSVAVAGNFDDIRSRQIRFLEEAAKLGRLTVLLWSDESIRQRTGKMPKFPLAERRYFLEGIRYVAQVKVAEAPADPDTLPSVTGTGAQAWVVSEAEGNEAKRAFCTAHGVKYRMLREKDLSGFPVQPPTPSTPARKKVVVTGCYDWFHTGHVRFCEEVSAYGDLYVVVGNDRAIGQLKGQGHPLIGEEERRYVVGSVRFVTQALISSGEGWLDADREIRALRPDIYAVNEDGDKGGKREYCAKLGIQYLVLKRLPAPGLPPRRSTDLRGF
ncbi:MAG TPA: adenylyltransferase/cytidyltransferase family protein [Opitutaceae bacterium]|nr:adenylyltransferase/cytidyltransferase family protein [Opitutaceae bacterium]